MAKTLEEPGQDEQIRRIYNSGMRVADIVILNPDKKYALCLLRIGKGVGAADYPALATAIEALPGVQRADILADYISRNEIPANHELRAIIEMSLRIDPIEV